MQAKQVTQAVRENAARFSGSALLVALVLTCGCASMNNTEAGALGGGAIGAGTGALVGNAVGHTGGGALIGAGVGALSGGLIGHAIDDSEKKQDAKLAAATAVPPRGPLGLTDVVSMAQQHISDDVIINQIRATGSVYSLSAGDIIWLKQNGVSDEVVREMQLTAQYPRRVYRPVPAYYVVPEPPPPPVSVGFGIGYSHGWR
jgi:hypothetical protein